MKVRKLTYVSVALTNEEAEQLASELRWGKLQESFMRIPISGNWTLDGYPATQELVKQLREAGANGTMPPGSTASSGVSRRKERTK